MIKLRDYQQECVDAIDSLKDGRVLVSMATGLGKTVIFSRIKRRGKVLILSHREELVRQPIKYYDCACGIEQGESVSHGEEVVSASVQSIVKRLDRFAPDHFDVIITDEAHHAAAPTYKRIYEHFKPRIHVGFTATPNRGDKVRLDDVFDRIIFQRDLKWGIKHGWLTDVKCMRVRVSYDVTGVKRRMGDFVVNDLDRAVNNDDANAQVAEVYKRLAKGRTLIFATSVSHAENIAARIPGAVAVSAKTSERAPIIKRFTDGEIPCLVNCMIFTEGTDIPLVETIIIARPTQNASLYTQMVGRGLRRAEGKDYLTLIDCVGVSDKLDICTAPSLMGLDLSEVPKHRRDMVQGMLTAMDGIVEGARDCPDAWIVNVQAVKLFADAMGVRTHHINWVKKSNGDLVYQFSCGDRLGIKAPDELGSVVLMRYTFDEGKGDFVLWQSQKMDMQAALDRAKDIFEREYASEKKIWDLTEYYNWQYQPASEGQVKYIQAKLSSEEWQRIADRGNLSKGEASQIISAIKIRNLKKEDLIRMHRKAVQERLEEQRQRDLLSKLKIRYLLDKSRRSTKVYAIKHPTDLVITNSWDTAQDVIIKLNESGTPCKYKGFMTVKEAQEYLRS